MQGYTFPHNKKNVTVICYSFLLILIFTHSLFLQDDKFDDILNALRVISK